MEVPLWNWEVKYDWCFREAVSKKGHFNCCVLSALPLLQNFLDVAFTAGSMASLKITSSKVLMVSGVFREGAKEQQHSGHDRRTALPCGLRNALTVPAAGKPPGKRRISDLCEPPRTLLLSPCLLREPICAEGEQQQSVGKGWDGDGEWFLCILSCSEKDNFFPLAAYRDKLLK